MRAVSVILASLAAAQAVLASAAALQIQGVAEGAVITLPSGLTSTNLAFAFPGGSGPISVTVEKDGQPFVAETHPASLPFATNFPMGRYFLQASAPGGSNDLSFTIRAEAVRPANDLFTNALSLTGNAVSESSNIGATAESDEPYGATATLWWKWRASRTGFATVATHGSAGATRLTVFRGSSLPNLEPVAESDGFFGLPTSQTAFAAVSGAEYFLCIDAIGSARGVIRLAVTESAPASLRIDSPGNGARFELSSATTNLAIRFEPPSEADIILRSPTFEWSGRGASGTIISNVPLGDYWLFVRAVSSSDFRAGTNIGFRLHPAAPDLTLAEATWQSSAPLAVVVTAPAGSDVTLHASPDLRTWSSLGAWTNFTGAAFVTQPLNAAARFFRAVRRQP